MLIYNAIFILTQVTFTQSISSRLSVQCDGIGYSIVVATTQTSQVAKGKVHRWTK